MTIFTEFQLDFDLDGGVILFFNNSQRQKCFEVTIIDDQMFEADTPENIILELQLLVGGPLGVAVAENQSTLEILVTDNETTEPPPTLPCKE